MRSIHEIEFHLLSYSLQTSETI